MTIAGADRQWETGARVLVLHHSPDDEPGRVGTVARIESLELIDDSSVFYTLAGELLVAITPERRTQPVDDPADDVPDALLEEAGRAVQAYMAALAESGESGDISIRLSPDPTTASHEVASYLRISWPEVQDLLEAGTARQRLERGILVLRREARLLRSALGGKGTT